MLTAMTLGEFIRQQRNDMKVSLRSFARQLDISPPFLSDIELDRRSPSGEVLERVAKSFKVPLEKLEQLRGMEGRVDIHDLRTLIKRNPEIKFALRKAIIDMKKGKKPSLEVQRTLNLKH